MVCGKCGSSRLARRGVRNGQQRFQCTDCRTYGKVPAADRQDEKLFELPKKEIASLESHDCFLISSSQANTPLFQPFWRSLLTCQKKHRAKLLIIPIRYRNPTSRLDPQDSELSWPSEVEPYLVESEVKIHPLLHVLGDIRASATAANPLTGMEPFGGEASVIIGHSQIAMKTVPTMNYSKPKILHTTGSVSKKNYSRTISGKKGEKHHSNGALLVKKEGGRFHIRVLNAARDGSFFDLRTHYTPEGTDMVDRIPALVTGDEHSGFTDPEVLNVTYHNKNSIVKALRPRVIVRHDVFDGYSCNPHHKGNPITAFAKWRGKFDSVEEELARCVEHIKSTTPKDTQNVIVASNHDDFLRRWLIDTSRPDPVNALVYHELWYRVLKETKMNHGGTDSPNPFALWASERLGKTTTFLGPKESFVLKGVELGMHGHKGPRGARGTLANLSRISVKSMFGHGHGPGIRYGAIQVGTSSVLDPEYVFGASDWMHAHGILLPNGKRQLIFIINGHCGL